MDNNFMLFEHNRRRCVGNCANCPFFSRKPYGVTDSMLPSNDKKQADDFLVQLPQNIFWQDINGICYTRYELLQDQLIHYCRNNYPWHMPIYMEVNDGQVVYISDAYTYEKHIKDIFKKAIDIAAEVTKDRNPQISIMFDGIGLVLADDVKEAVKKVFSILDKASNPVGEMR